MRIKGKASIEQALSAPDPAVRFYLFHGPDQGQSRVLATRLVQALGANRFIVISNHVKSDPASLADEAGAMTLFGGRRVIWLEPAGEEIVAGVTALLDAAALESPVVAIAGVLKRTSNLLKLAESSRGAIAYASYLPDGEDAERMVIDVARRFGLKVTQPVAARVAAVCGNDQSIVLQELDKFALYLDASPNAPKDLDHDTVDALGAAADGDFLRLADLALRGDVRRLVGELDRIPAVDSIAVPVVRSLQRRLMMLAPIRARIDNGESVGGVMASAGKSLFWRDKEDIAAMLGRWSSRDLATAFDRAGRLERQLMFSNIPAAEALGEELLALARVAARR